MRSACTRSTARRSSTTRSTWPGTVLVRAHSRALCLLALALCKYENCTCRALAARRSGYVNYSLALELLTYLRAEEEYLPWHTALSNLEHVETMLGARHTADFANYRVRPQSPFARSPVASTRPHTHPQCLRAQDFLIGLALPVVQRLGWEDRSASEPATRTCALSSSRTRHSSTLHAVRAGCCACCS